MYLELRRHSRLFLPSAKSWLVEAQWHASVTGYVHGYLQIYRVSEMLTFAVTLAYSTDYINSYNAVAVMTCWNDQGKLMKNDCCEVPAYSSATVVASGMLCLVKSAFVSRPWKENSAFRHFCLQSSWWGSAALQMLLYASSTWNEYCAGVVRSVAFKRFLWVILVVRLLVYYLYIRRNEFYGSWITLSGCINLLLAYFIVWFARLRSAKSDFCLPHLPNDDHHEFLTSIPWKRCEKTKC